MIKPLRDKIVVRQEEQQMETESGIVLPSGSSYGDTKNQGVVVAVGSGAVLADGTVLTPEVSVGDRVVFDSSRVWQIDQSGEELKVMPENAILVVL